MTTLSSQLTLCGVPLCSATSRDNGLREVDPAGAPRMISSRCWVAPSSGGQFESFDSIYRGCAPGGHAGGQDRGAGGPRAGVDPRASATHAASARRARVRGAEDALREAQRAQRGVKQAPPAQIGGGDRHREGGARQIGVADPRQSRASALPMVAGPGTHAAFRYREDSVLLELAQNADDALSQASEIADRPLPPVARRLVVRVHVLDGVTTSTSGTTGDLLTTQAAPRFRRTRSPVGSRPVIHDAAEPEREAGEIPGQTAVAATTGRFGLGFKSVHLVRRPRPSSAGSSRSQSRVACCRRAARSE